MHIRLHHLVKSPLACLVWYMMLCGFDMARAVEVSFTTEVDAGVRDCFHHPLKKDVPYETEFQVPTIIVHLILIFLKSKLHTSNLMWRLHRALYK